jgi:hypothetical protein
MYDHHMAVDILEGLELAPRIPEAPKAPPADPPDSDRLLKGTSPGL